MDWNTKSQSIDNLQVFIVCKYSSISGVGQKDGLFGHDNKEWDIFVILTDDSLHIGGVHPTNSGILKITSFPKDANPIQTSKFCVLSVHWNASGKSGCGFNKSGVYCNGKKLATFTADTVSGSSSFKLVNKTYDGHTEYYRMNGDIGSFLMCGSRKDPTDEKEILIVHKYLMEEWKINIGRGEAVKDAASKSYVIDMVENTTSNDCVFIATLAKDAIIKERPFYIINKLEVLKMVSLSTRVDPAI